MNDLREGFALARAALRATGPWAAAADAAGLAALMAALWVFLVLGWGIFG